MLIHSVYFSVKPEAMNQLDAMLKACRDELTTVPGVTNFVAGRPTVTDRPVVDRDYTFAITMTLADKAALAVYAEHPTHLAFIGRFKDGWAKVRVFDFEE